MAYIHIFDVDHTACRKYRQKTCVCQPVWLITQSDPIGHNRTPSDPIGPHRTNPHSLTSYKHVLYSIYKLPTSIQLWRVTFKTYSLLVSKVCADRAELRHIVSSYEQNNQHWVHLITALIVADRRWVDLIEFNWRCRQRSPATGHYIWNDFRHVCVIRAQSARSTWLLEIDRHASET